MRWYNVIAIPLQGWGVAGVVGVPGWTSAPLPSPPPPGYTASLSPYLLDHRRHGHTLPIAPKIA